MGTGRPQTKARAWEQHDCICIECLDGRSGELKSVAWNLRATALESTVWANSHFGKAADMPQGAVSSSASWRDDEMNEGSGQNNKVGTHVVTKVTKERSFTAWQLTACHWRTALHFMPVSQRFCLQDILKTISLSLPWMEVSTCISASFPYTTWCSRAS